MRLIEAQAGIGKHLVSGMLIELDQDFLMSIFGGELTHIGACALGLKASYAERVSVSSLSVPGHRDDILAREFALRAARDLDSNVSVNVGIHVDQAVDYDLQVLQENAQEVYFALIERLREEK